MGFTVEYPNAHIVATKRYSVALDASLFFCGSMTEKEYRGFIRNFLESVGCVMRNAQEVFVCWDGDKPEQKLQTQKKRAKQRLGATMTHAKQHSLVLALLMEFLQESAVQNVYIDTETDGEGEIKCVRFNGWACPVDCVYVLVNDNDTMLLLYDQPSYTSFLRNLTDATTFEALKLPPNDSRPARNEIYVQRANYDGPYNPPKFKVQFDVRRHIVKGVVDIFTDIFKAIGVENTHRKNTMAMLGMIIFFGNDYVNPIIHASVENLRHLFETVDAYDRTHPEGTEMGVNVGAMLGATIGVSFDIMELVGVLIDAAYEKKLNRPLNGYDPESVYYYYYRILWNFVYYHNHVLDMRDVVTLSDTRRRYTFNPFSLAINNTIPHPGMREHCERFDSLWPGPGIAPLQLVR